MAKWIDSDVKVEDYCDAADLIAKVERACRTCYKSEDHISEGSGERLIRACIARGHESPLEHASITFRVICDRGVSHEIVRHRIAAYSQESTRYCNYGKDKFGGELTFIRPWWVATMANNDDHRWIKMLKDLEDAARYAEITYLQLLATGATPEMARAVLPNCLKTELVMTMNIRELRHFIKLRTSKAAHPDIRIIAGKMLSLLHEMGLGVFFEDIEEIGV